MIQKKREPLLSKAAKMGQGPEMKPHSSPMKEKGHAHVKVGCSVIIWPQACICRLTGMLWPRKLGFLL